MNAVRVASLLSALTLTASLPVPAQAYYEGEYTLALIDSSKVPQFLPGLIPGEGSSLTDMTIELLPGRQLRGRVIGVWTDSGSVTDTITAAGTWSVQYYRLTLSYHWVHHRWGTDGRDRVMGQMGKGGFTIPQFAGFGSKYFRRPVTMAFRRSAVR